jgi:large subunit ribosomal protein L29
MKGIELREMTLEELRSREEDLIEELARQKIQLSIKRLDNPLQLRVTKRELARVKTIINEKIHAGETGRASGREGIGDIQDA